MTTLINQIQIVNLAPATPTAFPHGLNIDGAGLIPDRVEADDAELQINSADATNVVVENIGAAPVSGTVQASHLHTIERVIPPGLANLPVQPFIPQSGGGGGGGVTNPLILSTGNAAVAAPAAYASGAIGHGIDGDVGTADVQVGGGLPTAYSGLAIGWVDSFAGGTAQVRVAEEAALANAHVKLGGPYTGYAVAYRGCHAFGSAYAEGADAYISNYGRGSLVGGYAHGATQYARISTYGFGSWSGGFAHGTGGYGGLILTAHDGSFAHGVAKGGYILTNFAAPGSFAQGYATSNGYIQARGVPAHYPKGSFAQGYAKTNGIIETYRDGIGAFSRGYATNYGRVFARAGGAMASGFSQGTSGYISASGKGAHAFGCGEISGRIRATGYGSMAVGRSTGSSAANVVATGSGAVAAGYAYGNATVQSTGDGSFAAGRAYSGNSGVGATGDGSIAVGGAKSSGNIFASGYGCAAFGQVAGGKLYSGEFGGGYGNLASGYAESSARIIAGHGFPFGEGTFAFGHALNSAYLYTKGHGSFAGGYANAYDIYASGNGSFAMGHAGGYGIESTGAGAFAAGYANTALIRASAANSTQFGPGTNAQPNSVQVGNAGIRFRGLVQVGDPAGVQNGDFWMVGTALWVRTGGVSKAL